MSFGCIGCCGNITKPKNLVLKNIRKNTQDLKKIKDLKLFKNRYKKDYLNDCGMCANIVIKYNRMYCPIHPKLNENKELRKRHCDINHLCKTAYVFNKWNNSKQKDFVKLLKDKKLDWYNHSLNVDNGKFLDEFKKTNY